MKLIKKSEERSVPFQEGRRAKLEQESGFFELMAILTMVMSVLGVFMDWKWSAWISLFLGVMNIGNYSPEKEIKQILSGIFVSAVSIYLLYGKDPTPICEWNPFE